MSQRPPGEQAREAMERSEALRERTERNLEASSERRFRSRQARTIAQMLRFLRQERGRTSG